MSRARESLMHTDSRVKGKAFIHQVWLKWLGVGNFEE